MSIILAASAWLNKLHEALIMLTECEESSYWEDTAVSWCLNSLPQEDIYQSDSGDE